MSLKEVSRTRRARLVRTFHDSCWGRLSHVWLKREHQPTVGCAVSPYLSRYPFHDFGFYTPTAFGPDRHSSRYSHTAASPPASPNFSPHTRLAAAAAAEHVGEEQIQLHTIATATARDEFVIEGLGGKGDVLVYGVVQGQVLERDGGKVVALEGCKEVYIGTSLWLWMKRLREGDVGEVVIHLGCGVGAKGTHWGHSDTGTVV